MTVYIGTYTGDKSKGIYRLRLDAATGALSGATLAAETPSPSFLAIDPAHRFLYAVNETASFGSEKGGSVSAFAIGGAADALRPLNQQPSRGTYPCHVSVDATGRTVMVANYGSGSVAAYPVQPDGSLGPAATTIQHSGTGPNPQRQEGPHAHAIYADPTNKHVLACDLGADCVRVYTLGPDAGWLQPDGGADIAPGSGPRHLAFAPGGGHVYVINELLSTITVCSYEAGSATLTPGQTITTLPAGFTGASTTAEIAVHPSGRFVYGSNRGHDSIAIFSVDKRTGELRSVGFVPTGGKNPRSFAIDPTGAWLLAANQDSDSIVVLRIDPTTGKLTPTGHTAAVGAPACVLIVPGAK